MIGIEKVMTKEQCMGKISRLANKSWTAFRSIANRITLRSDHPLLIALFTTFAGFILFVVQTRVQYENELRHAQFQALQDLTGFYGSLASNLDLMANTRCELIEHRLSKSDINARSAELREILSKTHEKSEALKFRIAALFSPRPSTLHRTLRRWRIVPADPVFHNTPQDNILVAFQDLYQYYRSFEDRGTTLVAKIPVGMTCESDDRTYIDEFNRRAAFKFARIYNLMAPALDVNQIQLKVESRPAADVTQYFTYNIGGKAHRISCKVLPDNRADCKEQ